MAINYETLFDLEALAGLENRIPPNVGMNLTGTPNINYLQNLANLAQQQQGPVLGPDEFGSYTIPASDPTYRSGFDYARSIAGGIPMSQVIAPGVSYSPEQPGGYTQEQLNIPRDVEKLTPPAITYETPDDPTYFGTGIGGVNIPVDRKQIPFRNIFGANISNLIDLGKINKNLQYMSQKAKEAGITGTGGVDLTGESLRKVYDEGRGLFQNMGNTFKIDQDAIDKIVQERIAERMPTFEQPDLSQFVTREDIPSFIPEIPTGRDFSIDREALRKELMEDMRGSINIPDISGLARLEDIPKVPTFDREALIKDITGRIDIPKPPSIDRQGLIEDIRSGIELPTYQAPDLSGFARLEDIPSFDPSVLKQDILMSLPQTQVPDVSQFVTQEDIQKAIAGIDMPTYQAPDLSAYDTRIAELEQQLAGLQTPTGGRFSISQPAPRGLF